MDKCPRCGSKVEIMVNVTMLIPGEMENLISKTNIRKKEVKLYAASWESAAHFCLNKNCSWRYYPNLKKDKKD